MIRPAPVLALPDAVSVWLDLERGACREARLGSAGTNPEAAFTLTADYADWKRVLRRELSPIAGILRGRLVLQGALAVVVRHMASAEALVAAATTVPTRFLDE